MNQAFRTAAGRFIVAAAFGLGLMPPFPAQADINIVGSTHGQNYQGVAQPVAGQAAASVPLSLCDIGGPTPIRYQNKGGLIDLTNSTVSIPAGNIVVWSCTYNGQPNFLFRYTGGYSAMAYANILAPYTAPPATPNSASLFTTIVPGGTGCTVVAGGALQTDPGTGRQYISYTGCSQLTTVQADFATSDTNGPAFATNMCDPTPECAAPIANTGVTAFPIISTPFVVIVGNGVQKSASGGAGCGTSAGPITLTRTQVEAIYSGQVTNWNQLGYCVYPVQPLNPPDSTLGAGTGDQPALGTPFNASIDQSIYTCGRPITAGTRVIFDATLMKDVAELSYGSIGPIFDSTDVNWLALTVASGLECVQGQSAAPASAGHMNAITYNRADEGASPLTFGVGNVGRMRGGYPVQLDGTLPSNYIPPANIASPTAAERAASQKQFRCGRYEFWSDWVGIQRNAGNPNQALWNTYVQRIAQYMPLTQAGYFWAVNLRQPGTPVLTEMAVTKAQTKGPILFNSGINSGCF